tara:strand:- start:279 stop:725 length:447 start_codon:yes stop_codon:yes gene_type:complete
MRNVEAKILKALVFITLFLFLHQLIFSLFIPFIAPQDSLNDFKFIGFVVTFVGLHTFFALCTFIFSRLSINNKLWLITLAASMFVPAIYFVLNINYLSKLNISTFIVILFSSLIFDFIRKDAEGNYVRKYIKVLTNVFYLEDEAFGLN